MPEYYNDSPITGDDEDLYGVAPFAKNVAAAILKLQKPIGTTVALNGPWGAGKSSVVNLIRNHLATAGDEKLVVTEFKGWWYRGEEPLAMAFFQNLHAVLHNTLGDKVKNFIPTISRHVLQAGTFIGQGVSWASGIPVLSKLLADGSKFAETFFSAAETVEVTFKKLTAALEASDRRFLVIIDDIDRLSPDEALAIFRLMKSVGRLPNVMYLLVFDRELADRTVQQKYPSEGAHYLEKIIQTAFELPTPLQVDLNNALIAAIKEVSTDSDDSDNIRLMNIFFDVMVPYLNTPRHVARFKNSIGATWPAIQNEINLADFLALETLRLYEPGLFKLIRSSKANLVGNNARGGGGTNRDKQLADLLVEVPESRREQATDALQRVFPVTEKHSYAGNWEQSWASERRVCVEKYFETYFRLTLSDEAVPVKEMNEFFAKAANTEYVKNILRRAAEVVRQNGKSMVPVYLDELTANAKRVEKTAIEPLLTALFEIHDEIAMAKDKETGFMSIGDTTLRYHWLIRRLVHEQYSVAERTPLYQNALRQSALGWLVDFTSAAVDDYREREGKIRNHDTALVGETAVAELVQQAVNRIREAAADNSLLNQPDVIKVLYRWRDFLDGDVTEPRRWTDDLIGDSVATLVFADGLMGESQSLGAGDRVARKRKVIQVKNLEIIDSAALRTALERIRDDGEKPAAERDLAREFLDAWDHPNDDQR